jgi:multidrug resistance efflux pump
MKKIRNLVSKIKNPRILRMLIVTLATILTIGGFLIFEKTRDRIFIENSIISAPIISLSPDAQGKILKLNVYEGEKVKRGDPLALVGTKTLNAYQDGLVVYANNAIGSIANPQTPVVQMINFSDMRVAGTIDENKGLDKIALGQAVSFTVDALPGKIFWGYVDEISPTAKTTQLQFSVSNQRPTQQFVVYAKFNSYAYPQIKNGMSAKMTVYTKTP